LDKWASLFILEQEKSVESESQTEEQIKLQSNKDQQTFEQ
jgi:hypothetical protein